MRLKDRVVNNNVGYLTLHEAVSVGTTCQLDNI